MSMIQNTGATPIPIFKAVVKYVGGFWPIGVFFSGYGSFFFVPRRQTQTKASSCKYANS